MDILVHEGSCLKFRAALGLVECLEARSGGLGIIVVKLCGKGLGVVPQ